MMTPTFSLIISIILWRITILTLHGMKMKSQAPSQANKLNHKFHKLEILLMQENQNLDNFVFDEDIKKIITCVDNNINIMYGIFHLISSHDRPLIERLEELGYTPHSTSIEPFILISTYITSIPTYVPPRVTNSTQICILLSGGLPNPTLPMVISPSSNTFFIIFI